MLYLATKVQFFTAFLPLFVCFFPARVLYLRKLFLFHEGVSLCGSQLGADRQTFRHHVFELQTTVGVRMV